MQGNVYSFPDLSDHCPICGGEDCATRFDFYTRRVVDEHGTYYKEFPIARYKCNSKGKRKIPHSTFSLLPYSLIPYTKYSISFIMKILEELSIPNSTIDAVLDYVAGLDKDDILSISAIKGSACIERSEKRILKSLGIEAMERIQMSGYYKDVLDELNSPCIKQRLRAFTEFAKGVCCQWNIRQRSYKCSIIKSYNYEAQKKT